ncbi:tryptophan synthase subunit alpha [Streptomyces sp. 7N604]|uniref:tryptophan synthase subunit alpha n=1 Tax=Streptomyces sp. 7N604 TaxID=3457415 RepID=UPI003FD04E08
MISTWRGGSTPPSPPGAWPAARLDRTFAAARGEGRAALATYLPVGYPTPSQSLRILHRLAETADVIELGWPYSDPMMDGPVIQRAATQALAAGFRARHLIAAIRDLASAPASLLVMSYYGPLARYGLERAADDIAAAGAAGVILPDLPIEEADAWLAAAHRTGLHTVFVVAPTTTDARLTRICAAAGGMLYAPAVPGVTGSTGPLHTGLPAFVNRLRTVTDLPIGVGIGVSSAAHAATASRIADAVIVGSALIRGVDAAEGPSEQIDAAGALTARLAAEVRRPALDRAPEPTASTPSAA